jgi:hypothetical protein
MVDHACTCRIYNFRSLAMETFRPNRALLNPKFEGYKLNPIHQENAVVQYELQYKPTQATSSNRLPLSFEEVRSRITHNHLCVSSQARRALYVDADFNVVVIDVCLVRFSSSSDSRIPVNHGFFAEEPPATIQSCLPATTTHLL